MFKLQKKAPPAPKVNHLVPGPYSSTVISVEQAPGYAKGHAKRVTYELTDSSGNHYPYHETFRTVEPVGQRSENFFDYLENNGITDWEDFVGCQEELALQHEFVGGRKYLNIDQDTRKFVYEDEEGESDAPAE